MSFKHHDKPRRLTRVKRIAKGEKAEHGEWPWTIQLMKRERGKEPYNIMSSFLGVGVKIMKTFQRGWEEGKNKKNACIGVTK